VKALNQKNLLAEAQVFAALISATHEPTLFGVTDGKAVGTYLESRFVQHLTTKYHFEAGNAAKGIDLPTLNVDIKTTSITQPQSSCPFRSARQKVFGLGYSLLVFVYEKTDDNATQTAHLEIKHTIFIEATRTADYTLTRLLREAVAAGANTEDLSALMLDRNLPLDEIEASSIAEELLSQPLEQGYLTISNALQWRLQYSRAIAEAGNVKGVIRL
jgi:hypothetical protein